MLSRMRHDTKFRDVGLICKNGKIEVHAVVLAQVSKFFENTLMGPFKEATSRTIVLHDTTVRAAEVLVDYAYELDINSKLSTDLEVTLQVWALAHMYEITALKSAVEKHIVSHVNADNIAQLLVISRKYDSDVLIEYGARLFGNIDCKKLCADDMEKILSSSELIATEWNCAKVVSEWCVFHDADNETKMRLVRLLHFELLERSELQALVAKGNLSLSQENMFSTLAACSGHFMLHSINTKFCTQCRDWSTCETYSCGRQVRDVIATSVNMRISISEPQQQTFCRTSEFVLSFQPLCDTADIVNFKVVILRRWVAASSKTTFSSSVENLKILGTLHQVGGNKSFGFCRKGWNFSSDPYMYENLETYCFDKSGQLKTDNDFNFRPWRIGDEACILVNLTFALFRDL